MSIRVNGRDYNAGSSDSPFRTIEAAKAAVREYKTAHPMTGNIEVYLRGGEYLLDSTIKFDNSDSGENGYRIRYVAYPGETPIINGGQAVHGWQPYEGNIYRAYIGTGKTVELISENGAFGTKARYPNEGYNTAVLGADGLSVNSFGFKDGDVPQIERISDLTVSVWAGGDSGEHNWFQDYLSARDVDYTNHTIRVTGSASENIGPGSRYFLEGCLEFLDQRVSFMSIQRAGYIYYYPMNENIEEQIIIMPVAGDILNLSAQMRTAGSPAWILSVCPYPLLTAAKMDFLSRMQRISALRAAISITSPARYLCPGNIQDIQVKNCLFEQIGQTPYASMGRPSLPQMSISTIRWSATVLMIWV